MPTYEYRCKKCGYEFEKFQQITAEPLKKCPECGGHVERLISGGAGIIFKARRALLPKNPSNLMRALHPMPILVQFTL